jgi:hypothetical protein
VYVWLVIVVLFTVWAPDTFPTTITVKQVLNGNAVAGLVALSVVPPLAARVFDLSIAFTMSLTSVLTAHFMGLRRVRARHGHRPGDDRRTAGRGRERHRGGGPARRLVHRHPGHRRADPVPDHHGHQ